MLLYTISTQLVLNGFEKNILCSCRLLLAAAARLGAARLQLNPIQYTGRRPHWRLSWHTTMPGIAYHHARNSLSKKGSLVAERTASRWFWERWRSEDIPLSGPHVWPSSAGCCAKAEIPPFPGRYALPAWKWERRIKRHDSQPCNDFIGSSLIELLVSILSRHCHLRLERTSAKTASSSRPVR